MQSPTEILSEIWTSADGKVSALETIRMTGEEPQLPSSFRVAAAAQVSVAAAGLAAAQIWKLRSGHSQDVAVDMRHALVECRSERYLRVDDKPPPPAWDKIAGIYKTRDQRFVRLHTNFRHHRDAVCRVLNCKPERDDVQAALLQWDGEAFETETYAHGGVVAMMRAHEEWSATPHAKALAELPLIQIEKIGDASPKPWPEGDRPLAGIRVLDLSRVIAGPVAGRTLAAHCADVLLISGPDLPAIPWLTIDTGRGKLTSFVDLKSEQGRKTLRALLADADIFLQGYRPQAIAALGFSPEAAAEISPGIVYVTLSAYGHAGPWAGRRGFDSLVQTATGFNQAEGQAAGIDGPKELPAQMLDHATGYFMAFGAMMARARQSREGGSWHVRVSLAQTGRWLWNLGRPEHGLRACDFTEEAVLPFVEEMASLGQLRAVRHAAWLSQTPAFWARPANDAVIQSTVNNPGFTERGFTRLINRAEGDDNLATCIGLRPAIPRHLYLKLLAKASETVRQRLEAANPQQAREVPTAVREATRRARWAQTAIARDTAIAHGLVKSLYEDGRLDEFQVAAFAEAGKFDETNASIAALANVSVAIAENMMIETRAEGVMILAKVAGLSWSAVKSIIHLRDEISGGEPTDVQACKDTYERLRPSTAQQVLRFHRMQQSAPAA